MAPLKKTAMVETSVEISYSFLKLMIEDIVKKQESDNNSHLTKH